MIGWTRVKSVALQYGDYTFFFIDILELPYVEWKPAQYNPLWQFYEVALCARISVYLVRSPSVHRYYRIISNNCTHMPVYLTHYWLLTLSIYRSDATKYILSAMQDSLRHTIRQICLVFANNTFKSFILYRDPPTHVKNSILWYAWI